MDLAGARVDVDAAGGQLTGRWTDVFRGDTLVHLGIMGSIVGGTFQGFLKDRIAGPLPYAIAEVFFFAAFMAWFATIAIRHIPIRGPGSVPAIVLVAVLVPVLYLIHPGPPLAIELAGLRAWAEFPIACFIALTVIRNPGQVRAYVGLLLLLCVVTAVYGILQYRAGPDELFGSSSLAELRHGSTVFYNVAGSDVRRFRAYSTFTFPAPFASMMVFGILLAAAVATSKARSRSLRWLCALGIPLFFVGMTVSGTRAALVVLLLGLGILAWYRGLSIGYLVLIPLGLLAAHIGTLITAGGAIQRFRSVLVEESLLWTYLTSPVRTALQYLPEHPFGIGLGRTGIGVPFAITNRMPQDYFVFSDGDIGRAAVEMGVIGVLLLVLVLFGLIRYAPYAVRMLRNTTADDVALGIGALLLSTAVLILIGSPLSSAPHGLIWWFLFGALLKLSIIRHEDERSLE